MSSNKKETTQLSKTKEDIMYCTIKVNMHGRRIRSKRIKEIEPKQRNGHRKERKIWK